MKWNFTVVQIGGASAEKRCLCRRWCRRGAFSLECPVKLLQAGGGDDVQVRGCQAVSGCRTAAGVDQMTTVILGRWEAKNGLGDGALLADHGRAEEVLILSTSSGDRCVQHLWRGFSGEASGLRMHKTGPIRQTPDHVLTLQGHPPGGRWQFASDSAGSLCGERRGVFLPSRRRWMR